MINVGDRVKEIRPMTPEEMKNEFWDDIPYRHRGVPNVIVFESGAVLIPSMDEEGNGPGALFLQMPSGDSFRL